MGKLKYLLFDLLLSFSLSDAYKILVVFPIQSPSHGILGDSMVKSLLDGGHEVTYITPFVSRQPNHPKLHIIDVTAVSKFFSDKMIDVKKIMSGEMDLQVVDNFYDIQLLLASKTLENENVQNMLKDRQITFDAVIAEYMLTDMHSAFQAVYPCPFIWFSAYEPHWMILNVMHGPLNPAYTSNYMKPRVVPYSFSGRILELWNQIKGLYKHNYPFYNKELEVYNKAIAPIVKEQDRPLPDYNELRYNATLLMSISQVVVGSALPLPPSVVHVGGFHVDEPVKPLPEDLKKIMDNAKNGLIYFSLGSNIKSKELPDELKQGLLKVFGGLKQTVIWKFEETLPNAPKNIHMVQWAPQQSILAHPNLVLFVTHGGLLSVIEAIHFAKPLIAIPIFADQFLNVIHAESKGFAVKVPMTYHLHEDLKVALNSVLGDLPKYVAKTKEISLAYHDTPQKPKEAINFWVNHVIKTKGAPHLRSIALQIPLYQRMYLDLLVLILVALVVLVLGVQRTFCLLSEKNVSKVKAD